MIPRARRGVVTGFRSLRDMLICYVGIWGFWFQTTRAAKPDKFILTLSLLLMVAPSTSAIYRIVNALLGPEPRERRTDREVDE